MSPERYLILSTQLLAIVKIVIKQNEINTTTTRSTIGSTQKKSTPIKMRIVSRYQQEYVLIRSFCLRRSHVIRYHWCTGVQVLYISYCRLEGVRG